MAPTKGIVVGAGPEGLVVAKTESVRQAIGANVGEGVKTKPFEPQAKIPLPSRPMQVSFASGENALVVSTEDGQQLSVYETSALLQQNAQPAISIPTNGAQLRHVAPNPAPATDANSELVAMVTMNGELLMANLKAGSLVSGSSGPVLKNDVSSVSWSNKGKQLVAGLGDGTAYQMTPQGAKKDEIPRPPDLEGSRHVSSISWLENDVFLIVYTPNEAEDDMGSVPPSDYYIVTRKQPSSFVFRKLPEVCSPFGVKRSPAYQFVARLRDFKPHLKDALIISSTASTDVGLITRSEQPLTNSVPAEEVTGVFASTTISNEIRAATLPMTDAMEDTSTLGLAIDLSSTEKVASPIYGEDIEESSTPLPNVLLLNNDGIMLSWWFVYSESIRQKVPYPGLAAVSQGQPQQPAPAAAPAPAFGAQTQQPAFGQPAFGAQSPFGKPSAAPSFGTPSALGANRQPAFGSPSALGGGPSFGSPTPMGSTTPAFGAPSTLGNRTPQFGKSGFGAPSFGQPSTPAQGFGAFASPSAGTTSTPTSGGFGSFAKSGGFASLAASKPAGESPFAKTTGPSPFAKPSGQSVFGQQSDTAFGTPKKDEEPKGLFGVGSGGFVLGSGFKPDGTAAADAAKPEQGGGAFSMRDTFDNMLGTEPSKPPSPPTETMDDMDAEPAASQPAKPLFGTGTPSLFGANKTPTAPTTTTGPLFGTQAQTEETPAAVQTSKPASHTSPSPPSEKTFVAGKEERATDVESTPVGKVPEPPLPPEPTSKTTYMPGDTSVSASSKSSVDDAPLPPDFVTPPKKPVSPSPAEEAPLPPDFLTQPKKPKSPSPSPVEEAPLPPDFVTQPQKPKSPSPAEEAPLPPDFIAPKKTTSPKEEPAAAALPDGSEAEADESDFEDSGEELTHEVDEQTDTTNLQSFKTSPESSFGGLSEKSPTGGLFTKVSMPDRQQQRTRPLFGEISKNHVFPPPRPETASPRSPSPVRPTVRKDLARPETSKAVTTPGSALASRKAALAESSLREQKWEPSPYDISQEAEERAAAAEVQRLTAEAQSLTEDDEDERLRADLARPLEPTPTLDPFLPHQDYTGQTSKPGIPGQIERLYRDINSMIDTLGINSRSMASFLLYQESSKDPNSDKWTKTLQGDHPADILDEKLLLSDIDKLDDSVDVLDHALQQQRVQGVQEKLEQCQELLSKDVFTLRGQCASIRKTLDAHTDTAAVLSAPLSAEQANLQQDLRKASTVVQSKLAELEQGVSLLRAKIADMPRPDEGPITKRPSMKRPTVEAVTSTISTMMSMAESKSSDIDVLEAQLKKLGFDVSGPPAGREDSPFRTPKKMAGRFPVTPGSRGSDGPISAYHTPESGNQAFRSCINGAARASMLRKVTDASGMVAREDSERWKAKSQRRRKIVENLKKAVEGRKIKVRGVDDL